MKTITQFTSIHTFTTRRLLAKKIEAADLSKLIRLDTDPQVMATLGGLRSEKETREYLTADLQHWEDNNFGVWLFYLNDTGEWLGRAGLRWVNVNGKQEIELLYAVLPDFWGKGFATEIANACLEIAFDVLRLTNIVCFTLPNNHASRHVMENAGFQYECDFVYSNLPHVLYRTQKLRTVKIVDFNSQWTNFFTQEAAKIQNSLDDYLHHIYHIGSTAIPDMPAKPVIDIMLECENLDAIDLIAEKLAKLNYLPLRRHIIPFHSFFTSREEDDIAYHLHILERGNPQIKRHVDFRDYLIIHPMDAQEYAETKIKLAQQFKNDINLYVLGKDKLVQAIDAKAKAWQSKKYSQGNTGPLAKQWSKSKILKAMIANMNVQMTHFSQYLNQIELIRKPGITIVNSGLPDDTFNYVLDADFSGTDANRFITEITEYFQHQKLPFSWWISPDDHPTNLANLLEERGYVNAENNIGMYLNLDTWEPEPDLKNLKIISAKNKTTLNDFALVLTNDEASFKKYFSWIASVLADDDPLEFYVGYVDDQPVVRGVSCYFGQVVGISWLSTTPKERKKGYASAILNYQLQQAKERGYHIVVLQAASEAQSFYVNIGYETCGIFREFKLNQNLIPGSAIQATTEGVSE